MNERDETTTHMSSGNIRSGEIVGPHGATSAPDPAALAMFLAPCLGFLVTRGKPPSERAADALGEETWRLASLLWGGLRPAVEARPAAAEAAFDVAAEPHDPRARSALELQLEKLLAADPALAEDVNSLWTEIRRAITVAAGDRAVVAGRDLTGSSIVMGDSNVVRRGGLPGDGDTDF